MRAIRLSWVVVTAMLLLPVPSALPAGSEKPVFVVGKRSKIERISKRELAQAYLGHTKVWRTGESVVIVLNTEDPELMSSVAGFLGTTVAEFSKRWIRISLSGAAPPPVEVESDEEMIDAVSRKVGAIGFVSAPSEKVRIVEIE